MRRKLTVEDLQHVLDTHDNRVLSRGAHRFEDEQMCALECVSLARTGIAEEAFTDSPERVEMPDIRPLNDAPWSSDEARTRALLPLIAALSDWSSWSEARRVRYVTYVAIQTVNRIVSTLPHLSEDIHNACRNAKDVHAAEAAAEAAGAAEAAAAWAAARAEAAARAAAEAAAEAAARAAAEAAAWAARAAAEAAARAAAEAAAWAARAAEAAAAAGSDKKDAVLLIAVDIWLAGVSASVRKSRTRNAR